MTRLPWVSTLRVTNNVVNDQLVGNIWQEIGGGKFPDMYHPGFEAAVEAETATVLTPAMIADPYHRLSLCRPGGRTARHRA